MKYTTMAAVALLIGGSYLSAKTTLFDPAQSITVETYSDIFFKLESSPVSINEIITGASQFADSLCDETIYQEVIGESVNSCKQKFKQSQAQCAEFIIKNNEPMYTDKVAITQLSEKFINCMTNS
ncbi:hypothetical protein LOC50_17295 [Pseudoalteromonas sp. SCSIO 43095]|jgi:hypothetical protein|uniref:hypothetical protein n=1 Tax=Pseudoalteromonas TaxID=53246 RepID=UPI000449FF10|nr:MULTISPECIES: hypothetical protein [Pseudoalteromonas]EWS96703.1 hypothetical protein BG00_17380 [Pseudoalteromonas sp. SCSIO_11900]MBT2151197.1 hypothetical protein [Pseudoalteromonas tetraodonis]MCK8103947.1 hypothetical protein [Pseudoalteromonas sp. 2CM36K]MCK8136675.1 hypothetical protein [Pseudoalteromonas sp. 2CM28B]MDN3487874.1 hypothetical protein [Pseudoalteromonas sp. APC 3694]